MSLSDQTRVRELQAEFLRRLARRQPAVVPGAPSLLNRLAECDDELLELTLGELGLRLRTFARKVDARHPELGTVFDGVIADDHRFSQECLELLDLGEIARERKLVRIVPLLGRAVTASALPEAVARKFDTLNSDRTHVRLLSDVRDREEVRLSKRMQVIDLGSVFKKGGDAWSAQPDSFRRFLRFDSAYGDDIASAEAKARRYDDLGCTSLAAEVRKSLSLFRECMDQSYYGFNRVVLTNAAVILAKSHGWTFTPPRDVSTGSYGHYRADGRVEVPRSYFGKYNFDPDNQLEFSPHVSQLAGSPVFAPKPKGPYLYEPRVYPLHLLAEACPESVRSTVELLEAFPDAGEKPIFDHFGVVVPGVAFPPEKGGLYTFSDERGILRSYNAKEDAARALDSILLAGGYLTAALVGEREGKCYFICPLGRDDPEPGANREQPLAE